MIIESNGDLASSNKNENSNEFIPSGFLFLFLSLFFKKNFFIHLFFLVDQDDVIDMYNVRSAVIGTDKE